MNIAHRGASAYAPENTFAAYDKAVALAIGHVELDVHFSSDGHTVVIHDDTLDRTTDGSGPVASYTLEYLQSLDAGSWFSAQYAGERIPTLEGVLGHYRGRLYLHIELKARAEGLVTATADLVRAHGMADSVIMTSFDKAHLVESRAYAPELPAGWLVQEATDAVVAQARELGLVTICPRANTLTPESVTRLHGEGFGVRAWGVKDEALMRRVVDCGADGMTVDFPDRAAEYLKTRGTG